jgi:tRNA (guanosine-2'-O-)-methyltransferase
MFEYMTPKQIIETLEPYLSEARAEKLRSAVAARTRNVVTVLEKPYDVGNINAAMRSAEAFGFQDFHVIEGPKRLRPTGRTSAGAGKWLTIHKWTDTQNCFEELRKSGFKLIGTSGEATKTIHDIDFTNKTAVVFGSEHAGLSPEADELVDEHVKIPTVGMVESFNLSVAVALSLQTAFVQRGSKHADMTSEEIERLLAEYFKLSVPNAQKILDSSL